MNGIKGSFDSFRVEEAYNWRDDNMEITRRIVHETDEARLNNIAEHFNVDLSEIREFLEMKRKKMQKSQTNGDRIRAMTDEELAELIRDNIDCSICKIEVFETITCPGSLMADGKDCYDRWLDWLKQEYEGDEE